MENQNQKHIDPEALTHYLGNDEYRDGNKLMSGVEEDDEFDGFSADGNDLDDDEDDESDLPDFDD
ncbi:MAG TPA: hypothetical protein VNJ08_13005 [Bacteriovoracaceae bacterium]|nr:hypothetical protein [Bacteriovoracaceae bacterium]